MVDASSSVSAGFTLPPAKAAAQENGSAAQSIAPVHNNDRVQAWMPVTVMAPKTTDAVLNLPLGGPTSGS